LFVFGLGRCRQRNLRCTGSTGRPKRTFKKDLLDIFCDMFSPCWIKCL
jgi:hypothetical protein